MKVSFPMDPELTRPRERALDPETGEELDCTRCGACCEAGEGRILVLAEDLRLWKRAGRQDLVQQTGDGHFGERAFAVTSEGACVHLTRPEDDPPARGRLSICGIYAIRGSTCRDFQAGSWQCLEFRRDARKVSRAEKSR